MGIDGIESVSSNLFARKGGDRNMSFRQDLRLHVNVDHIATIRQARGIDQPDPVIAAGLAEIAGADGITIHLREDRRHIQDRDVEIIRKTVKTILNLEMALTEEMIGIACDIGPDICSIVPEKREERTTEGGLAVASDLARVKEGISRLKESGIRVSLFIDPDEKEIKASAEVGADLIELHTGDYCNKRGKERDVEFERLRSGAKLAKSLGLSVAGGHGLDYCNVAAVARIPEVEELNIGHSIVARASIVGIVEAVKGMLQAMGRL